jgi:type IV pilus assembly protein PilC
MAFFRRKLSLPSLIDLCRSMRYSLQSGVMLRDTMDLLANKGSRPLRPVAAQVCKDLKAGWSLQDALKKQEKVFPPLFIALCTVGEESGNLPEVLGELEKYYIMRQKLRREFLSQITWPVIQFVAAVFIVTGLIWVLGVLQENRLGLKGEITFAPLGNKFLGAEGAALFFSIVVTVVLSITALVLFLQVTLRRKAVVERFLLALPGLGPCFRAMALTRFCVAGRLMLETSLSIFKTLRLAFVATDNMAFVATFPEVEKSVRQGNSLATSFGKAGVFPDRFLSAVAVAEDSGRLPESLRFLSDEYDDETRRRLTWLTRVASFAVWLAVAIVIIIVIFTIFNQYITMLDKVREGKQ